MRNITDIDDKIIRRAAENGETPSQLTARIIAAMHEDFAALGMQPPDQEPRATDYIPQMLEHHRAAARTAILPIRPAMAT